MDRSAPHRHARVRDPTDEERDRPPLWRFWRHLPPKGKIGIFFGNWYTDPIVARVTGGSRAAEFEAAMTDIRRFERMLAAEGALLLKFWFHLGKKQQRERLESLEEDPKTRWRVTDVEWKHFKRYDRFRAISERALRETSIAEAPSIVVEGGDARYRSLTVGKAVNEAMRRRLSDPDNVPASLEAAPLLPAIDKLNTLRALNLSRTVARSDYDTELEELRGRLSLLTRRKGW